MGEDGAIYLVGEDSEFISEESERVTREEQKSQRETGGSGKSPSHYEGGISPVDYISSNSLDFFEGNVIKYVTRHKKKNGAEDIKKAIHYLEMILEKEYGKKL